MVDNGLTDRKAPSVMSSTQSQIHMELECPICYKLMANDLVTASDGYTYERRAIKSWLRRHTNSPEGIRSPKTNLPIDNLKLFPNKAMLAMAREAAARES